MSENCISKLFTWTYVRQTSNLPRIFHLKYPRPSLVSGSFLLRLLADSSACPTWCEVLDSCGCCRRLVIPNRGQYPTALYSPILQVKAEAFDWKHFPGCWTAETLPLSCIIPVTCRTFDINEGKKEDLIQVPPNLEIYGFRPVYKHPN